MARARLVVPRSDTVSRAAPDRTLLDFTRGRIDNRPMRFSLLGLALLVVGCSAATSGEGGNTGGTGGSAATTTGSAGGSSTTTSTASGTGGGFTFGTGGSGGTGGGDITPDVAEVFAHSASVLYRLDPTDKSVTTIGNFQSCGSSVIDIAIDKDGTMFATTFSGLYKVNKQNAACTHISDGGYPNSLSFVPKGTVDPNVEALVGYTGSTYVRIDTTTGAVTPIGAISGGYFSSGDIVSVIGGGTYLTVNGNGCSDCIIEVDPKTGDLKKMIGPLGHSAVYGLAFWGGFAYGFDDSGQLFQIDLTNGASTNIPMPNPPAGLSFWGAGSTTAAPIKPPT
ncbi:Peptidyl-prolyl cis-trans isomerase [Minicystis rosea]|nr:Peptidyl-prolyl cis-trans isomerase [Minicystis rosea]